MSNVAEKKLIAMRKEMFWTPGEKEARDEIDDPEMEAKKNRYMQAAEEINAAVEAGKISKQDAEKRLIGLRERLFGGK